MNSSSKEIIDTQAALGRVDNDKELYLEIIEIFMHDVPTQLEKLEHALAAGDRETANRQAHSLKSAAANIGAESLRSACYELETQSRDTLPENAAALLETIKLEFKRVSDCVSTLNLG